MSVLTKKLLRTIWATRGQVAAVVAVMVCGIACYICMSSLHLDLLLTRDTYYADYRFADFEIQLERAPRSSLFKLEEIPGVRQIRGRIVEDVKVELEGEPKAKFGRMVSIPDTQGNILNNIIVESGRYFEPGAQNEVIISEQFAEANGLRLGDTIHATMDGKKHSLKMIGTAQSPEYVYIIRNVQELVPSPERFGIFWVPDDFAESALNMESSVNSIVGAVENPEFLDGILDTADTQLNAYGIFAKTKRENQLSNRFLSDEITNLGISAKVMPTIFLGIASLVIMIILNRMVKNERTQIGLMKAYGHTNLTIALHYIQYALMLSVTGCIGGFILGQFLAGKMIVMYNEMAFSFPYLKSQIYPNILARSMGIAVLFSLFGAIVAARRAARIKPAESMRPEAPKSGRRTLLERAEKLWARLSFTWKMVVRNIARHKFRASLNTFGVVVSCILLVFGFFTIDAINFVMDYEYFKSKKHDVQVNFFIERGKEAVHEARRFDHVRRAEPLLQYPFTATNGWHSKDIVVIGFPRDTEMRKLYDINENEVDIGESGLVLTDKLAAMLDVNVGDYLELKPMMGKVTKGKKVRVSQVVQQYFGTAGYMNINALSRVLDEPYAMNAVLLSTEAGMADELNETLEEVPAVASIELKNDAYDSLKDTMGQSIGMMGFITIFFAGIIAFSIIYNITAVSLAERERELASLRVLGFTKEEVGRVLYNENILLGILGIIIGIPAGVNLCRLLAKLFDTEMIRLPFYISTRTILIAAFVSAFFIFISNMAIHRKIHKLDLIETLKERE
jgi:putative ABC transport system permease protein